MGNPPGTRVSKWDASQCGTPVLAQSATAVALPFTKQSWSPLGSPDSVATEGTSKLAQAWRGGSSWSDRRQPGSESMPKRWRPPPMNPEPAEAAQAPSKKITVDEGVV